MSLDALIVTLISAWTGAWRALGKTHSLKDMIRNASDSETNTCMCAHCVSLLHTQKYPSPRHETLKPLYPLRETFLKAFGLYLFRQSSRQLFSV